MKFEVEIEDGVIPEGKELVRIGGPKRGEQYLSVLGCTVAIHDAKAPFIIVRDKWTPGNVSLKPGWVVVVARN